MKIHTVNGRSRAPRQPVLFDGADDRNITKPAQLRNFAGEFFEEATAALVRGRRLKTDGTHDVCPDVEIRPGFYCESKSVGQNASAIVYQCRLQKDLDWTLQRAARLFYVFWHHRLDCLPVKCVSDLNLQLAAALRDVTVIELVDLAKLCNTRPAPRVLNTALAAKISGKTIGYAKYGVGWSLPLTVIRGAAGLPAFLYQRITPIVRAHDVRIESRPLWISAAAESATGIRAHWRAGHDTRAS